MPHNSETLSKPVGFEKLGMADFVKIIEFAGIPKDRLEGKTVEKIISQLTISNIYSLLNNNNFRDAIAASIGREQPIVNSLLERTRLIKESAQFAGKTMQGLDPDDVLQQLENIADAYKKEKPPREEDFSPF